MWRRISSGSNLLLVLVLVACGGGTAEEQAPEAAAAAAESGGESAATATREPAGAAGNEADASTEVDVPGAVKMEDLLFCGQPSREALAEIAGAGYRTVVSTRGVDEVEWDEKEVVESLGMEFVSIPMPHPVASITDEQVERFAETMETVERPIVMHCGSGNRVSGLWTVWLAERQGVEPLEALRRGTRAGMTGVRPVVEERLGVAGEAPGTE